MKPASIVLLLILSMATHAQNNLSTISMNGISDIKVGMKKAELEKLLNQSFTLPHLSKNDNDYYQDTVQITYKGTKADVIFQKDYSGEKKYDMVVWEVRSSSKQLKTKSGIGIGDDKLKIINAYQDFTIHIIPEYENDYKTKSKTRSSVWLFGDEGDRVIIFHLTYNKVTSVSVMYSEGG
jgi:hypothetical protein